MVNTTTTTTAKQPTYRVKRDGRKWGVYKDGILIEGGFFTSDPAYAAMAEWQLQDQLEAESK